MKNVLGDARDLVGPGRRRLCGTITPMCVFDADFEWCDCSGERLDLGGVLTAPMLPGVEDGLCVACLRHRRCEHCGNPYDKLHENNSALFGVPCAAAAGRS